MEVPDYFIGVKQFICFPSYPLKISKKGEYSLTILVCVELCDLYSHPALPSYSANQMSGYLFRIPPLVESEGEKKSWLSLLRLGPVCVNLI